MVLFAPLAVGAWRQAASPIPARAALFGWAALIAPLVWRAPITHFVNELADKLRIGG
jgi:hypothetical protein